MSSRIVRRDILNIICEWADIRNIRIPTAENLAYGVISAVSVGIGGLLFGRLGVLAASLAVCAFENLAETAVSLAHMIRDLLTAQQRINLTNILMSFVGELAINTVSGLLNRLLDDKVSSSLIELLQNFFTSEFGRQLMY